MASSYSKENSILFSTKKDIEMEHTEQLKLVLNETASSDPR